MIYSVYQPAYGTYDYYEAQGNELTAPAPKHLRRAHGVELGLTPDEALWPMPLGAMRVGSGKEPKGMLARRPVGMALGDFDCCPPMTASTTPLVKAGLVALGLWGLAQILK